MDLTRDAAAALDDADPLAGFRGRFAGTEDDGPDRLLYLDGNSLGRLPLETPGRGGRAWWSRSGARAGRLVVVVDRARPPGSATRSPPACWARGPGEVLVADSTSVNLYKLLGGRRSTPGPGRDVLVCTADDFPTDRYIVAGRGRARAGMTVRELPADIDEGLDPAALAAALDERVAVVVLSHVAYRSGALADLAAITAAGARRRRAGALGPLALGRRGAGRS